MHHYPAAIRTACVFFEDEYTCERFLDFFKTGWARRIKDVFFELLIYFAVRTIKSNNIWTEHGKIDEIKLRAFSDYLMRSEIVSDRNRKTIVPEYSLFSLLKKRILENDILNPEFTGKWSIYLGEESFDVPYKERRCEVYGGKYALCSALDLILQ